ncbi:MAG: replication initiator protein [Microvirus sp.]|nr:MAG: replication initiator protein [Microvirus sp.]
MPCYHPLPAWLSQEVNESGKRGIVFRMTEGFIDKPVELPCGTCVGCRLERAREWAVRCMHESKLYASNAFVTLTYDDENLPKNGSLVPERFVLFMKRMRYYYSGIRFFHCGEYGDRTERPHHHALLFNCELPDGVFLSTGESGERLYRSDFLERAWGHGNVSFGAVTFESAGYVARYSMKKLRGAAGLRYYGDRVPPYGTMSRRPGIGHDWALRFMPDWYRDDALIVNGVESKPPRYYDSLYEKFAPEAMRRVKAARVRAALDSPDNSGRRLVVREAVKSSAIALLERGDPL